MRRLPSLSVLLLFGAACTHTDAYPTEPVLIKGPNGTSTQITFNPEDDYTPVWNPGGGSFTYVYSAEDLSEVKAGSRCIGMVPVAGGSRIFSLCDTRAPEIDSSAMFGAVALRDDGQLLFMQGMGKPQFTPAPTAISLWIADTSAPLGSRHELKKFPTTLGDSIVDFLTDAEWIDANSFIAIANRLTYPIDPPKSAFRDTLPRPVYLVRGVVSGATVALSQIPGTDLAAHWTRLPGGDLLFVRGTINGEDPRTLNSEPVIRRIPIIGGTSTTFSATGDGGGVRGITCAGGRCIVLASSLYRMDVESGVLNSINLGSPAPIFANWSSPALGPDGTTLIYRLISTVVNPVTHTQKAVGALYRVTIP